MPVSIIDIDVQDEKFKAFIEVFNKYKAAVKELPTDWGKQSESIGDISQSFIDMTSALMAQKELFEQNREAAKKQETESRQQEATATRAQKAKAEAKKKVDKEEKDRLKVAETEAKRVEKEESRRRVEVEKSHKKAKEDTKQIARNIGQASVNLLKWVSIDAIAGGLLGGGGLFGLDKLANHTADLRLESNRLGVTVGEKRATDLNLGGFLDSPGTLENFAQAKSDLSNQWAFAALGVNPQGTDPAQLLAQAAPRARQLFLQGGQTKQFADAAGLTKLFSMDDLRSLANTDPKELAERIKDITTDKDKFNLPKDVQKEWFDFSRALKGAGTTVETAFIKKLSPLAGQLTGLSNVFAKSIDTFASTDELKKWISEFASGIYSLAKYMGSDKFQSDIRTFATDIEAVAEAIVKALKWLQIIPDTGTPSGDAGGPVSPPVQGGALIQGTLAGATGNFGKLQDSQFKAIGSNVAYLMGKGWTEAQAIGLITNGMAESGLNPGVQGDFNKKTGKFDAYGAFQWHKPGQDEYAKWAAGQKGILHKSLQGSTLQEQEDFLNYQLTQGSESSAGGKIRLEDRAGAAADATARWFERPKFTALQAAIRSGEADSLTGRVDPYLHPSLADYIKSHDPGAKNLSGEIQAISKETGISSSSSLNLGDSATLKRIAAALERQHKASTTAAPKASVTVHNATGGSAVVSTNSLAASK